MQTDKRYKSPAMRRKMGDDMTPPAAPMDENPGGEGGEPTESAPADDSQPTAFLPKEMSGGKVFKPGDEIVLTVKAVDPETGEMQVAYAQGADEPEQPDTMSAMDKQLPEDDEQGGY